VPRCRELGMNDEEIRQLLTHTSTDMIQAHYGNRAPASDKPKPPKDAKKTPAAVAPAKKKAPVKKKSAAKK